MDSLRPLRFLRASAAQWGPQGSPPPGAQGRAHSSRTGGQIQWLRVAPWAGGVGSIGFEGLEPTGRGGLETGVAPQTMVCGVGGTIPGRHTGVPTRLGMGSWGGRKGQHRVGGASGLAVLPFLLPTAHPDRSGSDKRGWGPTGLCSVALDAEGALVTCHPPASMGQRTLVRAHICSPASLAGPARLGASRRLQEASPGWAGTRQPTGPLQKPGSRRWQALLPPRPASGPVTRAASPRAAPHLVPGEASGGPCNSGSGPTVTARRGSCEGQAGRTAPVLSYGTTSPLGSGHSPAASLLVAKAGTEASDRRVTGAPEPSQPSPGFDQGSRQLLYQAGPHGGDRKSRSCPGHEAGG